MDEKKIVVNNLLTQADIDIFREKNWNCVTIRKGMKSPNRDKWQEQVGCPDLEMFIGQLNVGRVVSEMEVVFDIDMHTRNGVQQNGLDHLKTLESQLGQLPETVSVSTASGGLHLYFKTSIQFQKNFRLRNDFEIKVKAQTLLPPSRFAGDEKKGDDPGIYAWQITPWECDVATLPESWEKHLVTAQSVPKLELKPASDFTVSDSELNRLDDMLKMLDPDVSYPEWFKVMGCVKNYYGPKIGLEIFDLWSSEGTKYSQNEAGWLERQWSGCKGHNQNGEEITIRSLMYLANTTSIRVADVSHYNVSPEPPESRSKLNIPCDGLVKRIVEETSEQLEHQPSYGYLAALIILGTMAQRRIQCPKTSVMNWFALSTPPDSQKSVLLTVISDALRFADSSLVMQDPASSQAVQKIFETNASRFYGSDESIELLNGAFDSRSKNTSRIETYTQMLKYFGSQTSVLGQANAKSTDGSKTSVHPRLCWLAVGTDAQWTSLMSKSQFLSSGMASRFAPFTGAQSKEGYDKWIDREKNFKSFSKILKKDLKQKYGNFLCSSDAEPDFSDMKLPDMRRSGFRYFFESMKERQKLDPEHASIWGRMIERALWYAAVHTYGCERTQIEEFDIQFGTQLCTYHVELWDSEIKGSETSDIAECKMALIKTLLNHNNQLNKSALRSRIIPRKFSKSGSSQVYGIALAELIDSNALLFNSSSRTFSVSAQVIQSLQK